MVLALSLFLAMPEASEMLAGIVRQHGGTDAVEAGYLVVAFESRHVVYIEL